MEKRSPIKLQRGRRRLEPHSSSSPVPVPKQNKLPPLKPTARNMGSLDQEPHHAQWCKLVDVCRYISTSRIIHSPLKALDVLKLVPVRKPVYNHVS